MSAVPGQFTLPLLAFQHHVGQLYIDPAAIQFVRELRQSDLAIVEQGRWQRADGKVINIVCKVWRPFVVATPQDFRELLLEASKLHRLQHPHLTRFLGLGCFAHGSLAEVRESMFMVEEYVGTRTLRKLISEQMRCRHRNIYDARAAVRWATQVATALAALHEQQPAYVHNDVKADNVFLTDTSRMGAAEAKLGDLKPHRHVYDREPSTLSRHQQQQRTSSPKAPHPSTLMQPKYTLERSSSGCSSNDERRLSWSSAASSTAAGPQQHAPGLPLALASAACHTPHHQQQGSSMGDAAEGNSWSSACSTVTVSPAAAAAGAGVSGPAAGRVSSLPVPIAPHSGHASRGGSCPADWNPGLISLHSGSADVYAAAAAAGSPSYFSACSHRSYSSLSSGSLNSSSSMGLQDASSCPSSAPPDPHSLCAEIAAADAAADAAAAAAAAGAGAGASAEDAAAAGEVGGLSWRAVARQRSGIAVYLSDSASSTGARGPSQGKGVVASLADADAEDSSHSAAADVASSGSLDLTPSQLPQQQVVPVQGSKTEKSSSSGSRSKGILSSVFSSNKQLQQQSPCDFSTEADQVASPLQQQQQQQQGARISLYQRSKSSPLDGDVCHSPHMQLAHSAPDVLQAEAGCEEAVHHGSFLMPLQFSEPTGLCSLQGITGSSSSSNTADTTAALKVRTSRAVSGEQQQQQRLQRSKSAGQAKLPQQQQEGGSCVYYGWELLPSGAASPCGAVHSSMLDLFADVAGEDVVTSRRYRDSCHYTLVPGSFVQQKSPLSISASGPVGSGSLARTKSCSSASDAAATLPVISCTAASSAGGSASGRWASSSATSLLSMQQPQQQVPGEQPDRAPTVGKGYAPSAIESKQHGSNSAFAALTAIDCIAEEGSSIATDSCAPSRESSAHGGPHFYDSSPFSCSAKDSPQHQQQQQPLTPHNSLVSAGSLTKALGLSSLLKQRSSQSLRISSGLIEDDEEGESDSHSRSQHDDSGPESPQSATSPHKKQLMHLLVSASSGSHDSLQESGVPSALEEPQLGEKSGIDSRESSASTSADAVSPPAAAAAAAAAASPPVKKVRFSLARPAGSTASRDFSLLYAAPELIRGERPTEKVDVFAFGVLLYELLGRRLVASNVAEVCSRNSSKRGSRHGKQHQHHSPSHRHAAEADGADNDDKADGLDPMPEQQLLLTYAQLVAGGYRPPMLPHFPQPVVQLISSCWAPEPYERPRMSEVLAELRVWQKDRQLLSSLNSFVLALADMGYPGARPQPGCGCGCVIS